MYPQVRVSGIRVATAVVYPQVRVSGAGIQSEGVSAGRPTQFSVDTRQAGGAPPDVSVSDAGYIRQLMPRQSSDVRDIGQDSPAEDFVY